MKTYFNYTRQITEQHKNVTKPNYDKYSLKNEKKNQ